MSEGPHGSPIQISEVVSYLLELFGADIVGVIVGDHRWEEDVIAWAEGKSFPPKGWMVNSLLEVYKGALMLERAMTREQTRTWFISPNRALDYKTPVNIAPRNPLRLREAINRVYGERFGDLCPECGKSGLKYLEGSRVCLACGFSES